MEIDFNGGQTIQATIAEILSKDLPKRTKAETIAYIYKAIHPRMNVKNYIPAIIKQIEGFEREK